MTKKMGFGAVLAIVFGSQIGSGIFVLPASLQPFGWWGVYSWCFAGAGAILLAMVFASLCCKFPKTGGPHVYVQQAFGDIPAFFTGWTYWLVSWVSSSVVVIASIACLSPFFGEHQSPMLYLTLEICLLLIIMVINCKSVELSGKLEFVLSLLKFIPFAVVPVLIFMNFDASNIVLNSEYQQTPWTELVATVTSLAFWGFIGVECATTPAEAVENPSKTIPRAIVLGTTCVALIYFINNLAITGVVPQQVLAQSKAPYVDAMDAVFGGGSSMIIAIITSIVCIGTLNAWVLTSAQISLGLAQDKLLPPVFAKKNKNNAPYISVMISCLGMIPILVLTKNESLTQQITYIIDFSVKAFLLVYTVCCLSLLKFAVKEKKISTAILSVAALLFCGLMIAESSLISLMIAALFALSGIFIIPTLKKI
ncbi:MAG: APC family permease [Alphaproteobacteria bacterium]|nr:APC family permease [Alphaproteobacteria bacterium]